jgi:hypothetical protein
MDSGIKIFMEQLTGWYDSMDRLRVGSVLRSQQAGSVVVNFMKRYYPDELAVRRFAAYWIAPSLMC